MNLQNHRQSQNVNQTFEGFLHGTLLEGRAENLQIFGWHFERNDDIINSS